MFDMLKKGPLQELYNVSFYIAKDSFKFNQAGYEKTESKKLATKT